MIKRNGSYPVQRNEKMRGGEGVVTIEHLLSPEEMYEKGRLFAKLTLGPGSSAGFHVHEGEMESFFIVSGEAEFVDNDQVVTLKAGDTALTSSGEGHSLKNSGDGDLEVIALILYK